MNKYKKIIPIVILASLFFFSISRMNNQHCCNHPKSVINKNPMQSTVKKETKETEKHKKQRNKYSR